MDPDKEEVLFPMGYEDVAQDVAQQAEYIRSIDAEIERLRDAPEGGGPKPQFTPDGAPVLREPTNAEKTAYLMSRKEQIQKDSFESVEKRAAREKNPTTQRMVMDAARDKLYGNIYKGRDEAEMHATRQQQGRVDLEHSADYMDAQRGQNRQRPEAKPAEEPRATMTSVKSEFLSPSYQAAQSLMYTRMTEKTDNTPDKPTNQPMHQDKQGPEKPLLPSEMASLSLNYIVTKHQVDYPLNQGPDKSPEPDTEPDLNP